jgi:hypothetical protein
MSIWRCEILRRVSRYLTGAGHNTDEGGNQWGSMWLNFEAVEPKIRFPPGSHDECACTPCGGLGPSPIPLGFGCCRNGNTKIAIMFVFHVAPGNAEGRRPRLNEVER